MWALIVRIYIYILVAGRQVPSWVSHWIILSTMKQYTHLPLVHKDHAQAQKGVQCFFLTINDMCNGVWDVYTLLSDGCFKNVSPISSNMYIKYGVLKTLLAQWVQEEVYCLHIFFFYFSLSLSLVVIDMSYDPHPFLRKVW